MSKHRTRWAGLAWIALLAVIEPTAQAKSETMSDADLPVTAEVSGLDDAVPLFLAVTINGKDTGLIAEFSAEMDGSNMSATRKELGELGIAATGGLAKAVELESIEGLSYRYDVVEQAILIDVPHAALLPDVISAGYAPEFEPADEAYGAALNYSLVAEQTFTKGLSDSPGAFSASLNGWAFAPLGRFGSTGLINGPLTTGGPMKALRLDTAFIKDYPDKALTLTIGDFATSGPAWLRPIRMGGVELRRNFSLRSDLITDQRFSYQGAAAVPSSVDVFIENNRVFSTQVDSGPFRLEDVPVQGGGDAEIVVNGTDGQITRRTVSFFSSARLLKKGMADYSIGIGFAREGFGIDSNDYGQEEIVTASLRYGVTGKLTVNAQYATMPDLHLAGVGFSAVPFALGEVHASVAASQYQDRYGYFAEIGASTRIGGIEVNATSTRTTKSFADLAYVSGLNYLGNANGSLLEVPLAQDVVSLSVPVGRDNRRLGLAYVRAERATSRDSLASVSYGTTVGKRRNAISLNGAYNFETGDARISLGLSIKLGKRAHARSTYYTDARGENTMDVSYSKAMGDEIGDYGYRAQLARRDDSTPVRVKGDYRSRYGVLSGEVQQDDDSTYLRAQIDGAAAFTGGKFAFGNQVRDSFAVVDLGVGDVPVYLDNRPVAKTNGKGRVLVNGLNSYRRNRVSVDVRDLPADAALGVSAVELVPSRGAGQHVDFGGSDTGGVLVILHDAQGQPLPPGTLVYANGAREEAYVGYDGETWIETAKPSNTLKADLATGPCTARFGFRPSDAVQDMIGPVTCN